MANLKELSKNAERVTGGHRLCAGCGAGVVARQTLIAAENMPVVVVSATGCLEVSTSVFPYTSWKTPFFHSAFENSAATCSGVEAAYKSLVRQGKIKDEPIRFIAFGGDGGTYDIGLQSELMISVYNHCRELWKEVTECFMFATTTKHT